MKKFFTLIAFAVAALTANAEVVINSTFENIVDGVLTTAGNWWYQSSNFGTIDDTDCTYLVMQLSENENGGNYMVYGPWRNEPEGSDTWVADHKDISVAAGQKLVAWKISDLKALTNFSWEYSCFVISAKPETKCVISKVSLMTDAEYEAVVKADAEVEKISDLALPTKDGIVTMEEGENAAGWYSPGWIGKTNLNSLYKTLVFEVASADAPYNVKVQGSEDGSTWDDNGFATYYVAAHSTPAVIAVPVEGIHIHLGQYAFQNNNVDESGPYMNQKGEMVSDYLENKVVVTRVYLTSKVVESDYPANTAGIEAVEAAPAAQKTAKVAKDGKIVIVKNGVEFNVAGQQIK